MSTVDFEGWAIVELMGHRRLGGYVREATVFGVAMLRIDVPNVEKGAVTQYYAPSALYALTPTSEEAARLVAKIAQPAPVQRWELPQLSSPTPAKDPSKTYCESCDRELDVDDPTVVYDTEESVHFHARCAPTTLDGTEF